MVQVTDTAAAIARLRAAENELPAGERLFEDPLARLFVGGAAATEATERLLTVPFFREHVRLRTRFIDDCVRASLADGIAQIVVLGAGFDCRALRMPEIAAAGALVLEVDLGAQLETKRAVLAEAGVALPGFLRLVPCDVAAPDYETGLSADLARAGFHRDRPALHLCEGVLGYLDAAEIDRSLRWMARSGGAGSRAVFNYPIVRIDPARLAERLRAAGFASFEDQRLDGLYRRYLGGEPPAGGDFQHVVVART